MVSYVHFGEKTFYVEIQLTLELHGSTYTQVFFNSKCSATYSQLVESEMWNPKYGGPMIGLDHPRISLCANLLHA